MVKLDEEFKARIETLIKNETTDFINFDLKPYIDMIEELTGIRFAQDHPMYNFYEAPASTKFHGAYRGGLVKHSLAVYYAALKLARSFDMSPLDIDPTACIFHDLVKANLYLPNTIRGGYTYNGDAIMLPHGSESLRRMSKYGIKLRSEAWEMAVAYHMGAFEKDNADMYSKACDKYREVLLLHTADMIATKIYKC